MKAGKLSESFLNKTLRIRKLLDKKKDVVL